MTTKILCNICNKEIAETTTKGEVVFHCTGFALSITPLVSVDGTSIDKYNPDEQNLGHLCEDCIPEFFEKYKQLKGGK